MYRCVTGVYRCLTAAYRCLTGAYGCIQVRDSCVQVPDRCVQVCDRHGVAVEQTVIRKPGHRAGGEGREGPSTAVSSTAEWQTSLRPVLPHRPAPPTTGRDTVLSSQFQLLSNWGHISTAMLISSPNSKSSQRRSDGTIQWHDPMARSTGTPAEVTSATALMLSLPF